MHPSLKRTLLVLACGGFVSGATIRIAEPLLPMVSEDLGTTVAEASVLITGFTLAYGLFQLVHGPLGDRIGKLRTMTGALLLAAFASAACAFATDLDDLALYRFLTGMTAGAVIPLSFAYLGDHVPFEARQPVLGRFISGTLLGAAFGPLIGGVAGDALGWRATFWVPAAAFVLIALLLFPAARREERPAAHAGMLASYAALWQSTSARIVCLAVGLEGFLFYGALAYLGAYLRQEFVLSFTAIGVILAGFGIGGVAYSLSVGILVRHLGQPRMVALGGALLAGVFALLAFARVWWLAPVAVVLSGLGFYMLHNTLQTRATEMAPAARGCAVAVFAFCLFFGQSLGVFVLGHAFELAGYRAVLLTVGVALASLGVWFSRQLRGL